MARTCELLMVLGGVILPAIGCAVHGDDVRMNSKFSRFRVRIVVVSALLLGWFAVPVGVHNAQAQVLTYACIFYVTYRVFLMATAKVGA